MARARGRGPRPWGLRIRTGDFLVFLVFLIFLVFLACFGLKSIQIPLVLYAKAKKSRPDC